MWVGGVGWSQTFINHSFYGIFDPFFVGGFLFGRLGRVRVKLIQKMPKF